MKHFFNDDQEREIVATIKEAERDTSGEIQVRVEHECTGDVRVRATEVFEMLNVRNTAQRNGVLIYIATKNEKFVLLGDEGISNVVPADFWDTISRKLAPYFQAGLYVDGLCEAIRMVGKSLKTFFPYHDEDVNELPDEISAE